MENKNQPIGRMNIGNLKGAIFLEQRTDRNGNPFDSYSISLVKSYQDQQGNWCDQKISIFDNQLLEFSFLCERLYASIMGHKAAKRKKEIAARQSQEPPQEQGGMTNGEAIDAAMATLTDDIPF